VSDSREIPLAGTDATERRKPRRAVPDHSSLYTDGHPVRGPRFRALSGEPAAAANDMAERLSYVHALETQVGTLTQNVHALEQQLAAYSAHAQELEASQARISDANRAAVHDILREADETITAAEQHVRTLELEAQRKAGEIVGKAQADANEMIAAVTAEVAAISEQAASTAQSHEASELRGQIRDLLRLRESILTSLRGAVEGFGGQLDDLEKPLFESPAPGEKPILTAVPSPAPEGETTEARYEVSILVRPVEGVVQASEIERLLGDAGAGAHLRAVEGDTAEYAVAGVSPDHLRSTADKVFPDAQSEWVAADRMQIVLREPKAS
jgi:hypothetical protein